MTFREAYERLRDLAEERDDRCMLKVEVWCQSGELSWVVWSDKDREHYRSSTPEAALRAYFDHCTEYARATTETLDAVGAP